MAWYWAALIAGVVVAGFMNARAIVTGFREGGIQVGLGAWLGYATFTIPLFFLGFWLGKTLFDLLLKS